MYRLGFSSVVAVLIYYFSLCSGTPMESAAVDIGSRIINGEPANHAQFRYTASLQTLQPARGHVCGCTLITFQHCLTSASCCYILNTQGNYVLKSPAAYRVFSGAVSLTNDTNVQHYRAVASFAPHPGYTTPPSTHNDLCIIVLMTPFNNATVAPIRVFPNVAPPDNANCTTAGWGATQHVSNTVNTQLTYASKYVYNEATCAVVLNPQQSAPNVLPLHICAASYTFTASCTNDTGNALVCDGLLTGVLSWHPPCYSHTSWPDLYTRASNYSVWINSITGAAPTLTPPAILSVLLAAAVLARLFDALL